MSFTSKLLLISVAQSSGIYKSAISHAKIVTAKQVHHQKPVIFYEELDEIFGCM